MPTGQETAATEGGISRPSLILRLLLLVPLGFLFVFFVLPIAQMVLYSFYRYDPIKLIIFEFTLSNYAAIFTDSYTQGLIIRTVTLALLTTIVSAFIAFPLALRMVSARGTEKMIITLIVLSPLIVSPIVLVYPWLVLLAPNTGIVTQAVTSLGLEAPRIMYTESGVLIGLIYAEMVFMVLSLHTALENIDPSLQRAASVLGASSGQVFCRITLPLALPGLISGAMLVFSISASSFMMPYLLGGRQVPVLATYAYDMASVLMNWPSAAAVAGVLFLIMATALVLFSVWIVRLERRYGRAT